MELFFDSFSSCLGKIFSFKRSRLGMTRLSHEERAFLKGQKIPTRVSQKAIIGKQADLFGFYVIVTHIAINGRYFVSRTMTLRFYFLGCLTSK